MFKYLSKNEDAALKEFKEKLNQGFGERIKNILLYGSKVRGDFHKESDIDVFILIDEEDYKTRNQIVDMAFDLLLKYGVDISPRVVGIDDYRLLNRWETSFIKNVLSEGIRI